MTKFLFYALGSICIIAHVYSAGVDDKVSSEEYSESFDWIALQQLVSSSKGNVVFSPLSLKIALAVLYQGASGNTATQIQNVMRFVNATSNSMKFGDILKNVQEKNDDFEINVGTKMYVDKDIRVQQKYQQAITNYLKADIEAFNDTISATVKKTNNWIKDITQGSIKELVNEEDLENVIVLILNAIYVKAKWDKPFETTDTKERKFYLNATHTINAPFIRQTNNFEYTHSESLGAKFISMPYKGDRLSIHIALPDTIEGLNTLLEKLNHYEFYKRVLEYEERSVEVTIPKFKFDFVSRFIPILYEIGIRDLFEATASLPGIARGSSQLIKPVVSNIMQKAGIELNENGTTAYAATEISLVNRFSDDEEIMEFLATKPFLFLIRDNLVKQVLFMGAIRDPLKSSGSTSDRPIGSANSGTVGTSTKAPNDYVTSQKRPSEVLPGSAYASALPTTSNGNNLTDTSKIV